MSHVSLRYEGKWRWRRRGHCTCGWVSPIHPFRLYGDWRIMKDWCEHKKGPHPTRPDPGESVMKGA